MKDVSFLASFIFSSQPKCNTPYPGPLLPPTDDEAPFVVAGLTFFQQVVVAGGGSLETCKVRKNCLSLKSPGSESSRFVAKCILASRRSFTSSRCHLELVSFIGTAQFDPSDTWAAGTFVDCCTNFSVQLAVLHCGSLIVKLTDCYSHWMYRLSVWLLATVIVAKAAATRSPGELATSKCPNVLGYQEAVANFRNKL